MLLIIATLEVSLDPEKIVLVVITAQLALINLQLKSALQVVIAQLALAHPPSAPLANTKQMKSSKVAMLVVQVITALT